MELQGCKPQSQTIYNCRACHSNDWQIQPTNFDVRCNIRKFRNDSFKLWRCDNCQSINILGDVDLDSYYSDYPFNHVVLNLAYRLAYNKRIRLMKQFGLNKDSKILDFGCGDGAFVEWLLQKGYCKSFGYDKYSKNYANPEVLKQKYDYIVGYDVIEHFDEPEELFKLTKNSLNPKGYLLLGTPDADRLNLNDPEEYLMELHPPYHRIIFSTKAIKEMGEKYKLKFLYKRPGFYMDQPLPFLNYRFISSYVRKTGGFVDVAVEDPNLSVVFKSPQLWLYGLLGFLKPMRTNMTVVFQA